ncbi:MAG: M10 family metallopeptidase C-terminal domain-containing protein [Pseudomonadota bacterium]
MPQISANQSVSFDRDTFRLILEENTTYTLTLNSGGNIISQELLLFSQDERGLSEFFLPYIGLGDAGFDRGTITTTFTTVPGRDYFVSFTGDSFGDADYTIELTEIEDDAPDNETTTLSLALGESLSGLFETVSDRDWIRLDTAPNQSFLLSSNFGFFNAGLAVIGIDDATGELVSGPDFGFGTGGTDDALAFSTLPGVTYYAVVNNLGQLLPFNDDLDWVLNLTALPNDAPNNATTTLEVADGETLTVPFEARSDTDWVRLDVTAGDSYAFSVDPTNPLVPGIPSHQLLKVDPATGQIVDSNDPVVPGASILVGSRTFTAEAGFDYYVRLFGDASGGLYEVSLSSFADDAPDNISTPLTLTLDNDVSGQTDSDFELDYVRLDLSPGASYIIEGFRAVDGEAITTVADVSFSIVSSAEPSGEAFGRPAQFGLFSNVLQGFGDVGDGRLDYTVDATGELILSPEAGVDYFAVVERRSSFNGEYLLTAREAPTDTPDNANTQVAIVPNSTILGLFESREDQDWVRIDVEPGETVMLQLRDSLGTSLSVYAVDNEDGSVEQVFTGGLNPFSDRTAAAQAVVTGREDATLYIQVTNNRGVQTTTYTLSSTPIEDDVPDAPNDDFVLFAADSTEGTNDVDSLTGSSAADVLNGQGGNDRISGLGGDDTLAGGAGDDRLIGGGGNDDLIGGSGDDVLLGGIGGDLLDGGAGRDTASYAGSSRRNVADLQGSNAGEGDAAGDRFRRVEDLEGGNFIDVLFGDAGDNLVRGGRGADRVAGRAGDDTLDGGVGFDKLYGNAGQDIMTGGGGNDRFIYFRESDSRAGSATRDRITDFDAGDRIELSRLDADTTSGGNQAFDFIERAGFSGTAGELRFFTSAGSNLTLIQADTDGDASSDFEIQLTGLVDLVAGDFVL